MIYAPAEDTFFMCEILNKNLNNKKAKIIEIGTGSGYILEFLKDRGFKDLSGVDINPESVNFCIKKGLNVKESNLFSNIKEKYDIIIFNPPYLPTDKKEDKESRLSTTGGKSGSEVINLFLKEAKPYLNKNGKMFLLTSSLSKRINWHKYNKKLLEEKKLFFEKLFVWELSI